MRRKAVLTLLASVVLALALAPAAAFAEEAWVPGEVEGDPYAELWGAQQEEVPLAATAEEAPEGAKQVKSLKLTAINSGLVPHQLYYPATEIDKSDPTYGKASIAYEYWLMKTGGSTSSPGGYNPFTEGSLYNEYEYPMIISPEEIAQYGVTNKFWFAFGFISDGSYTLAPNLSVTCQGKTYKGRVIYSSQGDRYRALVVLDDATAKVAYPVPLYRMYNTKTSEHLWTKSAKEYESAGSGSYADWKAEGVAWYVPVSSAKPVYRLYNTKSGDHHYTTSMAEKDKLVGSGQWRDEGIAFYSATAKDTNTIKIYRVYNSRLKRGQHHYTRSAAERDSLVKNSGWKDEGIGFYGYSSAKPKDARE